MTPVSRIAKTTQRLNSKVLAGANTPSEPLKEEGLNFGYRVVFASKGYLTASGYALMEKQPFIYDGQLRYHRLANQFLIDRALGYWDPANRGKKPCLERPTDSSTETYADQLANVLDWCDVRGVDPMKIEYGPDLLERYQAEMVSGAWSKSGLGLSESTINGRIDTAIAYLCWCADRGFRAPLEIQTTTKTRRIPRPTSASSHKTEEVEQRLGKMRIPKRRIRIPRREDVTSWLSSVYGKPDVGPTEGLLCELILESAIRLQEAACWRLDTLPIDPNDWEIANEDAPDEERRVLVEIRFGCKGKQYGRVNDDKIGPRETILVPLPIARRIHSYRQTVRSRTLQIAIREGKSIAQQKAIRANAVHLFLNPETGQRYTGDQIYEIWRSVPRPRGWSPHRARDFWACSLLLERMRERAKLISTSATRGMEALDAMRASLTDVIELEIKPQLRHASADTTMTYLQWATDQLSFMLDLNEDYAKADDQYVAEQSHNSEDAPT